VKRPRDVNEQFRNELAAMELIREAPPFWVEFYKEVHRFVALHDKARAYNQPRDNAAAADALTELRYVVWTLAEAEEELAKPPIDFAHLREGGAP